MTAGRRQVAPNSSAASYSSGSGNDEKDGVINGGVVRKTNKPLMEKRRRARINKSIAELESLIIIPNEDQKGSSKLEKADILEITVRHLKELCELQKSHLHTWSRGFNDCIKKANDYLMETGHSEMTQDMTNYLTSICKNKIDSSPYFLLNLESNNGRRDSGAGSVVYATTTTAAASGAPASFPTTAYSTPETSLSSPPPPPVSAPTFCKMVDFSCRDIEDKPINLVTHKFDIQESSQQREANDLMWRPWSRSCLCGRSRRKELLHHYCMEQQLLRKQLDK